MYMETAIHSYALIPVSDLRILEFLIKSLKTCKIIKSPSNICRLSENIAYVLRQELV
jgi:hypothetical protein